MRPKPIVSAYRARTRGSKSGGKKVSRRKVYCEARGRKVACP